MSVVTLEGEGGGGGASAHSALTGLGSPADDHDQYLFLAGRAGGQSAFGGTVNGQTLDLSGANAADRGTINLAGRTVTQYNWTTDVGSNAFVWAETIPVSGVSISSMFQMSNLVNVSASTFILSAFRDTTTLEWDIAPGFAVTTLFFAQSRYLTTTPGISPAQHFTLAAQPTFESFGGGAATVTTMRGVSVSPILRARNAGDQINLTSLHGLTFSFLWNTNNATALVDAGNAAAVKVINPTNVLFGGSAGTERCTNFYGIDYDNINVATTGERAVVHSSLVASSINYFLKNDGNAQSVFGTGIVHHSDNGVIQFGGAVGAADTSLFWNGSAFQMFFWSTSDSLLWTSPAADRFLLEANAADSEMAFNFARFAFGQSGAVGNQVGVFVAPTRTVSIGGEWSDFLLTQAGNITVDAAMSLVAGWTINAPSITLGTGSVTTAAGLNIGGNPTGATNRVGMRILSNPTGGGGVNAALWVTAGRSQFDGFVDINKPVALGGGAAATLGNVGGAGPTAAAQAQWVQIEVAGVNHWIPAWT